jgi:anaerobic carbon-monoxide dehydrogenase iron sulfur subunit
MAKAMMIDYRKCHGCRECETACALRCDMEHGGSQPRITAITWELEGRGVPVPCQHCQDAPCMALCPKDAIHRDEELNRVMVDYDRCIGCRMCVAACPFGAMRFDADLKRVVKCDYCDGDPLCAKLCSYGALQYLEITEQHLYKSEELAQKLKDLFLGSKPFSSEQSSDRS